MLKINSIILSSADPSALVDFYNKVFEREPDMKGGQGQFSGWEENGTFLGIGPDDRIVGKNQEPSRVMFNLETDDVEGEFARIKARGAEVIAEPYSPSDGAKIRLATFSDPDNNYFQLVSPMSKMK